MRCGSPATYSVAPSTSRAAFEVSGVTFTCPCSPHTPLIRPTAMRWAFEVSGWSAAVALLDVERGADAGARRGDVHQRADGVGDAALAADDAAFVLVGHGQPQHDAVAEALLFDDDLVGMARQRLCEVFDERFHRCSIY